jgi:hypothetical protein
MKSLIQTLIFFLIMHTVTAQETGIISGIVLDELQQPMYGAKCKLYQK